MATIVTRAGKASPLTNQELDSNFNNLNTDKAELSGAVFTGAITTNSTIDGRDVATDGTKLDGIEASATADQTGAQIKTAYEAQTNAFTDAQFTKLGGIEASATADQTAAEIRALVESATDSNVFTDADHTKLNGVEASADVTDTANVTAAGALMDSELTSIASVKALNQGVATGDSPSFAGIVATTADINGGTIDGTVIGGATPAAISGTTGQFGTSLNVDGTATMDGLLVGGNLDITSEYPRINLTDTNNNPDWSIINANGIINFYDQTNATNPLKVKATGIDVAGTATISTDLNVGGAVKGNAGTRAISVGTAGSVAGGVQLWAATNQQSFLQFGDEAGTAANHYRGYLSYNHANDSMSLGTSGSTRATIDSSGNVGIGVTPEAWNSAYTVLQTGGTGAQWSNDAQAAGSIFDQGQNIYRDASAEKYIVTDEASKYRQYSGTHIFQVAPSGTADAVISWNSAMTIDNSGNVLVGKSSNAIATAGAKLGTGGSNFTRSGAEVVYFNRTTNDGAIATFAKDGTTVGTIGTVVSRLFIGNDDVYLTFQGASDRIYPASSSGGGRDNAIDLGEGGTRFKDLYLSGGVYLGGTGAANKLDDYEEGTWTPTIKAGGTLTISSISTATYTKIGRSVTVQTFMYLNDNGNGASLFFEGLPFAGIGTQYFTGVLTHANGSNTANTMYARQNAGGSEVGVYRGHSTSAAQNEIDGNWVIFSLTYQTNS